MIRTQIFRKRSQSYSSIKHATEGRAIHDPGMNSESDNAPSVLIHNDQHPVRAQCHRFTSEQIDAVKAVFRVPDEGEPGWPGAIRFWSVVKSQDPADHILINSDAESQLDLLGNTRTSPL